MIMRDYGEYYLREYNPPLRQIKLIRAMRICKSAHLGGRVIICNTCGHNHYIYNSCGHSHCPICQSIKREQWIDKLKNELLNVAYVHMVFTLPHQLNGLAKRNKRIIYSLIIRSSWQTVKKLSGQAENIDGVPGMISVLHTFGSDMKYHIHAHCLVTFGGWNMEMNSWQVPKRRDKIARYREINRTYRAFFLQGLKKAFARREIIYHQTCEEVYDSVKNLTWVVHNTKPTMDTSILEKYLARYINRVAVSNSRVQYIKEQSKVNLLYNDYANQKAGQPAPKKTKEVDPLLFINQFMQHMLPAYFQKSRRYGLHASATKKKLKDALPKELKRDGAVIRTLMQIISQLLNDKPYQCELCHSTAYSIFIVKPDQEWIFRFIKIPTTRPPPKLNKIA